MKIVEKITQELGLKTWQTEAVIRLIDEGNTIPFIARYRKEAMSVCVIFGTWRSGRRRFSPRSRSRES